ncbi:MAG: hypothetical protein ACXVCP_09745 [Bdellovibrio sp.]
MKQTKAKLICSATAAIFIVHSPITAMAQPAPTSSAHSNSTVGKSKSELRVGKLYYISADKLNVRSSNSTTEKNIVGKLLLNDEVAVYNVLNEATPLVQIKILKSNTVSDSTAPELYVSKDYLSEKPVTSEGVSSSKYFVVQNIATEKTRVYERCTTTPNCPHKMVMETDMVVGRSEEGTEYDPHAFTTWLGHARISEWIKFYQDGAKHYPNWYRAGQSIDDIPSPINKGASKIISSRKWVTTNEHGDTSVYGAFGWYAAKISPADPVEGLNYQWMHGTIGWGRDGSAAIELTRSFLMNLFSEQGSAGCTRLENRAIAYLRYLLPVGTDIYRVYAKEATREQEVVINKNQVIPLPRYSNQYYQPFLWSYTLLTDGAQQSNGLTADSYTIYTQRIPFARGVNLIEDGSYKVDQYPNAAPIDYSQSVHSGKSGDRYQIDNKKTVNTIYSNFHGYFLVDEGRFIDYHHPDQYKTNGAIRVGGLPDFRNSVPEFLKTSGRLYLPNKILE